MMDKKHLTLGSLFDGSGGFRLAASSQGSSQGGAAKLNLFRCLSRTSDCLGWSTTAMYPH